MTYEIYRTDNGLRVSVAVYFTEATANAAIERTRERVAKGGRPDLARSVSFFAVRKVGS